MAEGSELADRPPQRYFNQPIRIYFRMSDLRGYIP